jgi:hypothetical protein
LKQTGLSELRETIASRLTLDVKRVRLAFDPGKVSDREQMARVYRLGRVVSHDTHDGRVSLVADIPRRLQTSFGLRGAAPGSERAPSE